MTTGIHLLEAGDTVEFKGPLGSFVWLGDGVAKWRGVDIEPKKIGFICGGSGRSRHFSCDKVTKDCQQGSHL